MGLKMRSAKAFAGTGPATRKNNTEVQKKRDLAAKARKRRKTSAKARAVNRRIARG